MQATTARKMDLSDLLNAAGQLYTENAVLFLGVFGIAIIIEAILTFLGRGPASLAGLVGIVGEAALVNIIAARIQGRTMSIGEAYSSIPFSTYVYFLVATILYVIAVVIGFILVVVPGVYLLVRFVFVPQAIIVERTGIFEAFSRSGELVSGNWWRIFVYGLVLFILYAGVTAIASEIGGFGGLIALVVQLLAYPFVYGVLTALYFNLRGIRGEAVSFV